MAKRINDRAFFTKPAEELAKDLIGKIICYQDEDDFVIRNRIKVTEAYRATDDVTDANRTTKETAQTLVGGHLHYLRGARRRLDIVAGQAGEAESVLIRGLEAYQEGTTYVVDAIGIYEDEDVDGMDLVAAESKIWLEDDGTTAELAAPTARIGLSAASTSKDAPLRFSAKSFHFAD